METILNNVLDFLRDQYPQGTRVRIRANAESGLSDMKAGDIGALEYIDDAGKFHVRTGDGAEVGLTMGRDKFDILPPEITGLKLYMPMAADIVDEEEDPEDARVLLDSDCLTAYRDRIAVALEQERTSDETARGVMSRYQKPDGVSLKVLSAEFRAEVRDGNLWCVTDCKVMGRLTPEELDALKGFISDQARAGWGKSFEQRRIETPDGDIYVYMWRDEGDWSIQTEEERFPVDMKKAEPDQKLVATR